jgi:hypothetical protein
VVLDPSALVELAPEGREDFSAEEEPTDGREGLNPDPDILDAETFPQDRDTIAGPAREVDARRPPDDPPLVEGFEKTRLDDSFDRRRKKKEGEAEDISLMLAFSYSTCPVCNAEQPQPSPAFCDACGNRLKRPAKKGTAETNARRCIECGFRNRMEESSCTNCGSKLH